MSTQPQFVGSPSELERLRSEADMLRALARNISAKIRVALPGVVVDFDADKQTCSIDLAIQDRIVLNDQPQYKQIPRLLDVPIVLPRAGGFTMTMPIVAGTEVLVIFADMCVNAWWTSGANVNPQGGYIGQQQERPRRHSLSDAFAIVGTWSQPNVLSDYSTDAVQLRSDDGNTVIELGVNEVTITAQTVTVNSADTVTIQGTNEVDIESSTLVNINGSGHTTIEGKDWLTHTHSGVQSGGSDTGPVT
jgi:hypothetical protein